MRGIVHVGLGVASAAAFSLAQQLPSTATSSVLHLTATTGFEFTCDRGFGGTLTTNVVNASSTAYTVAVDGIPVQHLEVATGATVAKRVSVYRLVLFGVTGNNNSATMADAAGNVVSTFKFDSRCPRAIIEPLSWQVERVVAKIPRKIRAGQDVRLPSNAKGTKSPVPGYGPTAPVGYSVHGRDSKGKRVAKVVCTTPKGTLKARCSLKALSAGYTILEASIGDPTIKGSSAALLVKVTARKS